MSVIHTEAPLAVASYTEDSALAAVSKSLPSGPLAADVAEGLFSAFLAGDVAVSTASATAKTADEKIAGLLADKDAALVAGKSASVRMARIAYILTATRTYSSRSLAAKTVESGHKGLGKSRIDQLAAIGRALTFTTESAAVDTYTALETARQTAGLTAAAVVRAVQENPKTSPAQVARAATVAAREEKREAALESGEVTIPALKVSRVTKEVDALLTQVKRSGWAEGTTELEKSHALTQVRALLALLETAPVAPPAPAPARAVKPASERAAK